MAVQGMAISCFLSVGGFRILSLVERLVLNSEVSFTEELLNRTH